MHDAGWANDCFCNGEMRDLSILIPARNEVFLEQTIKNILENAEADTEVIAVLDG